MWDKSVVSNSHQRHSFHLPTHFALTVNYVVNLLSRRIRLMRVLKWKYIKRSMKFPNSITARTSVLSVLSCYTLGKRRRNRLSSIALYGLLLILVCSRLVFCSMFTVQMLRYEAQRQWRLVMKTITIISNGKKSFYQVGSNRVISNVPNRECEGVTITFSV